MYKVFAVAVVMAASSLAFAQNLSNRGKEFWVGYGHHQFMEPGQNNSQEMVLYFSAEEPANVTVTINGTSYVRNYSVPANTVIASQLIPKTGTDDCRLYSVPPSFGGTGGEGVFTRGIHIVSDVPIVAYAHIYGSLSSGATMLMPVETWGYTYATINSQQRYGNNDCFSWVYVVAKEDNTVVEIVPSERTRNGRLPNVPFTVNLNKGEIYQVIGAALTSSSGYELTGTKVKSVANAAGECFPVGVFAGSSRTAISCTGGSGSGDNIMQQIFPFQAWGKRYLTAPTSSQASASVFHTNIYRIAVKDPTARVLRNGVPLTNLQKNFYYEYQSNTADYIEADKPILVAQYMSSSGGCPNTTGFGDPEMMYISPIEQAIKRIGFYRNDEEGISLNYLTLIIPTPGVASLRIDNSGSFTHTYPHPRLPGYTVVVKRWTASKSQCIVQSDSAFTAVTYGIGSVESYGYNAGTLINNLSAVSSIHNVLDTSTSEHKFTCTNTPVQLSVLLAYKPTRLQWLLSELGSSITPNANVVDNTPLFNSIVTLKGVPYYKYTLPGTYIFNTTDTFELPILSTHPDIENCNNTERVKIEIIVNEKPRADFSFTHLGCTLDTAYLSGSGTTTNNFSLKDWKWDLPGGVTKNGQNAKHLFPPGANDIKLTVVSTDGCLSDTAKKIIVTNKPSAGFSYSPLSVCEGGTITFSDTAANTNVNPVNTWEWQVTNGGVINNTAPASPVISFPSGGRYTVKHVVKSSATCISDTISKVITIYAKPKPSFTYPVGCLPLDGNVQFVNTTTVPDSQNIPIYAWDFGDANATGANPNTSMIKDPSHIYIAFGNYNIKLTATTENGCTKDTTVAATLNIRPKLNFTVLNPVCENSGVVSIAKGSVTNGVTGKGYYKGTGTDSSGMFSAARAGAGSHTIWYVFESSAGCKDSLSQDMLVHAKPKPAFAYPSGGCLQDGTVQFTNTTTIADAQTLTYSWNFNDPLATPSNPNISSAQHSSHTYSSYGSYDIRLSVISQYGCEADTVIKATFNLKPKLAYGLLQSVCENAPVLSLAKATISNGVPGTGIYKGPATDAAGNFTPYVAKAGVHTVWYVFTSTAGCADSVYSTIKVQPKPVSAFTVDNQICLGELSNITDNSTIVAGTIKKWTWDLGDGTSFTNTNNSPVSGNYNIAKTYTVKLVTESDSSCVSDAVTQIVTVHPLPVSSFDLPVAVCMPDGTASFKNRSVISNSSSLGYQWNFGDGAISNLSDVSHKYAAPGPYTVTLRVISAAGCMDDSVQVLNAFYNQPVADFGVNKDTLCQGTQSQFTDRSTSAQSTIKNWSWSFGDGSNSSTINPVKTYRLPGRYNVRLTVTDQAGCTDDITKEVLVNLQPVIDAGPSFVIPIGTTVLFNPRANDSATLLFSWSPASDFADPTRLRQSLKAVYNQTYYLAAVGVTGCSAVDSLTVKILKPVNVPNAFSPNGDNVNDTWIIRELEDYPGATVEVFNRYGQRVFYSSGYSRPWDGTYNGRPLPLATYYYVITLKNGFPPVTGSITILK